MRSHHSLPSEEWKLACTGIAALALSLYACSGDDDVSDTADSGTSSSSSSGATSSSGSGIASSSSSGVVSSSSSSSSSGSVTTACTNDPAAAVNTAAIVDAANAFLGALTDDQKATAQVARTLPNAIQWSNFPAGVVRRNGVRLGDLTTAAQQAALALVDAASSAQGATLLSEIRAADDAFSVNGGTTLFGDGNYYFSIHGTASTTEDWMLQVAGHHFVYNFSYGGACTSATPLFDGAQPAKFTDSSGQAHDPLAAQRNAMAALFASVSAVDGAQYPGTFSDMINGPAAAGGGAGGGGGTGDGGGGPGGGGPGGGALGDDGGLAVRETAVAEVSAAGVTAAPPGVSPEARTRSTRRLWSTPRPPEAPRSPRFRQTKKRWSKRSSNRG